MTEAEGKPGIKLCLLEELAVGAGREFRSGRGFVAVFRGSGGISAWLNSCPHQGRSLNFAADEFLFTGEGRLVCPHHGAVFDLDNGACLEGPCKGAGLTPVTVRLEDGAIWLQED